MFKYDVDPMKWSKYVHGDRYSNTLNVIFEYNFTTYFRIRNRKQRLKSQSITTTNVITDATTNATQFTAKVILHYII
jgi:hypothetical protein